MSNGKSIQIGTKTTTQTLLLSPDLVLQQVSLNIFKRRENAIRDLVNARVTYDTKRGKMSGTLEGIDDLHAIVREGSTLHRVHLNRIDLDALVSRR